MASRGRTGSPRQLLGMMALALGVVVLALLATVLLVVAVGVVLVAAAWRVVSRRRAQRGAARRGRPGGDDVLDAEVVSVSGGRDRGEHPDHAAATPPDARDDR